MKKIIFVFLILPCLGFSQFSVKGRFSPAEAFTYAFLYKATPNGANYVNRAKLDSVGSFTIPLDTTVAPGIYKIVYAIPPEENNFDFIYNGKESVTFNFSLGDGVSFTASKENKLWNSYLESMDMVNQTISNFYTEESKDENTFQTIFKTLDDTQTTYEESSKGTLAETFIKANKPYIPSGFEDVSTYYDNVRQHYFSNVDFDNELLQSSTFISDRVNNFVFGMVAEDDKLYTSNIDLLAKVIGKSHQKIRTTILEMIWYGFVQRNNDTMANYLCDAYLLDLAKATQNTDLIEELNSFKNTAIGAIAPDFEVKTAPETVMLSQLNGAEHYLLIFWSSGCGHCLDELPQVKDLAANTPNVKVIAFGLEDDMANWSSVIKNYPDFIHTVGLGKWDNPTVKTYGIRATPTYFVLDKNKTIIAKPNDVEDLQVFLDKF